MLGSKKEEALKNKDFLIPFQDNYISSEPPDLSLERFSRSATPHQNVSQHGEIFLKTKFIPLHNVRSKVIGKKLHVCSW